ncbi:DUF1488 family protein [Shewanella youngdeokensis]|uniref:DUF1488 domain-containing protein n=1 Tax=Shewanella youngdeokensis TaxID=2999068 RepID=A0ABZ0K0J7_9GAMM|nr:DUF1488 domain-containing protein [Shewanella sp. DAU334]
MNQSILFPDLQDWESQSQSVIFPAQVQGRTIECSVGVAKLAQISQAVINHEQQNTASWALAVFDEYRFDIEDEVERLIEQESFDESGRVLL